MAKLPAVLLYPQVQNALDEDLTGVKSRILTLLLLSEVSYCPILRISVHLLKKLQLERRGCLFLNAVLQ